jgi:hypothetical protein
MAPASIDLVGSLNRNRSDRCVVSRQSELLQGVIMLRAAATSEAEKREEIRRAGLEFGAMLKRMACPR